uniref:Tektin n=1 Tax=Eptatretus burgeri TaxID=7764 RepID=A0A8C4R8F5_EPTBU
MDKRILQMSSVERNDWQTHLCDGAMAQRLATDKLCRVSQNLRDNTKLQTRWEQHETEIQLHGRMVLQERWRETLHSCLVLVESESEAFRQSKNVVQAALDAKDVPANVLSNCKRLRDQRHGPELVRDEVEIQLEIEVKIIEESRKSLKDHLLNISRQLCVLEELQKKIRRDLHDKSEALQIDEKCLALTNNSPCISFKPNPARISDK